MLGNIKEIEATGVYAGELAEDMIDTVKRTGKLYCDVYIDDFYTRTHDHPLTYVPLWTFSPWLKKGDKVLVQFNQGNLLYPVLYRNPSDVPSELYQKFNVPGLDSSDETVSAVDLGNAFILSTKSYTVIHRKNACVVIDDQSNVMLSGKDITLHSSGETKVESSGSVSITGRGTIDIKTEGVGKVNINGHLTVSA